MYPILYENNDFNFQYLGKGKMAEVTSCTIHEELNGEYSADFTYPVTGARIEDLYQGGLVMIWGPRYSTTFTAGMEWFDIVSHSMPLDGLVTFHCQHISRRLSNAIEQGPQILANTMFQGAIPNNEWGGNLLFTHVGSMPFGNVSFTIAQPKSLLACMIGAEESCAANFGGEFAFWSGTTSVSQSPFVNWSWVTSRGQDRGVQVRFGYNLQDFNWDRDRTGCFNAYLPYWQDPQTGTRVYATSPIVRPTTPITPAIVRALDCSSLYSEQPTPAQLEAYARSLLDATAPWLPQDQITVDMLNGQEVDPHSPPVVLGDIVHAKWLGAGIEINQKVVSYTYDSLQEKYTEITIGTPQKKYVAIDVE